MDDLEARYARLRQILQGMQTVAVAYSGGVDSTLLVKVAHDLLGERALAITGVSATVPQDELDGARRIAAAIGVTHIELETRELEDARYLQNTPERCYFCKQDVYTRIVERARQYGIGNVVDGANADDASDHRPGRRAALERGLRSPLLEAGLTKDDIRTLARRLALPNWDKPSAACLASRIPYGTPVEVSTLRTVERAEALLRQMGLRQLRVRYHQQVARIEAEPQDFEILFARRQEIASAMKALGFLYVTLDLEGFRSGSMNEGLDKHG
jgi:uncharacterized protein